MGQEQQKQRFLEAFDAYADSIFRFCLVKTTDRELAEDLTQETFTRLWQAIREGRDLSELRGFLYAIARNLIIDWYRKKKPVSLDRMADAGFEPAESGDAAEDAAREEVLRAIATLDQEDREVLLLRMAEGLPPADVAAALGISPNHVSVRTHRAVERLRSLLHYE